VVADPEYLPKPCIKKHACRASQGRAHRTRDAAVVLLEASFSTSKSTIFWVGMLASPPNSHAAVQVPRCPEYAHPRGSPPRTLVDFAGFLQLARPPSIPSLSVCAPWWMCLVGWSAPLAMRRRVPWCAHRVAPRAPSPPRSGTCAPRVQWTGARRARFGIGGSSRVAGFKEDWNVPARAQTI
jgi:hypothetical protein